MAALESPTLLARLERVERYLNSPTVCYLCISPKFNFLKHACQMFRDETSTSILEKIKCSHSSILGQATLLRDYYVIAKLLRDNSEHANGTCTQRQCLAKLKGIVKDCHFDELIEKATPAQDIPFLDNGSDLKSDAIIHSVNGGACANSSNVRNDPPITTVFNNGDDGTNHDNDTGNGDNFFDTCSHIENEEPSISDATNLETEGSNESSENSSVQNQNQLKIENCCANNNDYFSDLSLTVGIYCRFLTFGKRTIWEIFKRSRFK